jgi:gluconokinase
MAISSGSASRHAPQALAIVVMGVSGAGKTVVGRRIAEAIHAQFVDGDDLHTEEARTKMGRGEPLTDEDRWPWLDRIAAALRDGLSRNISTVIACSALRGVYRDRLRERVGARLHFLYLKADRDLMRARVANRKDHYMPASLVDSQFATLEPPDREPDVIAMPADADLDAAIPKLAARLAGAQPPS